MTVEATLLFVLAAVAVVVIVRWVAGKTGLPATALLTLVGILYAFLPGRNIELEPHLILTLIIPPLLYDAAIETSLLDIRRNLRTVISLSVALVLATALLIGVGFGFFVAGATLAAGIALGAAVAPPDPVAALSVGRKVGLPGHLVTLIQGEGLLNDATALTILSVAVAAAGGGGFSFPAAVGQFVIAAAGGVLAGWLVAYVVRLLRPVRTDPISSNAISLATPFAAYLLAERVHVSGVLAVVVAGLIIGHHSPRTTTGASRLQTTAVWRLVDFLLEGLVFLLIGQQLPTVIKHLSDYSTATVVIAVAISLSVVLLLRPLWLVLTQWLPRSLHTRLGLTDAPDERSATERPLDGPEVIALSWAGTRGVISLAAIFTLPQSFPDRNLLIFCTFVVVLVTLVGQGLTFAPLVSRFGPRANEADKARQLNEARSAAVRAALARLDELRGEKHDNVEDRAIENMRRQLDHRLEGYQHRLDLLDRAEPHEAPRSPQYEAALAVRRAVIDAQREELLTWRDEEQLSDEGFRILNRELDHEEQPLAR